MRLYFKVVVFFYSVFLLNNLRVFGQKSIKSHNTYTVNNQVFTKDSVPLHGYYKINYTSYMTNWKKELSHFKDGYRQGESKILRFNKLEEEGVFVKGLRYGKWNKYHYFNGALARTTTYINGLKNGKEMGYDTFNRYVCNYVNDTLEGAYIKYDRYPQLLGSKEFYKKGKKLYKYIYDDFLNIIKEEFYTKLNDSITIKIKTRKVKDNYYVDSLYYKQNAFGKEEPYLLKAYKNNTINTKHEINISKDKKRTGSGDFIFTIKSTDKTGNQIAIFFHYYEFFSISSSISNFRKWLLEGTFNPFKPCDLFNLMVFEGFENITIYYRRNRGGLYEISYEEKDKTYTCSPNWIKDTTYYKQCYRSF